MNSTHVVVRGQFVELVLSFHHVGPGDQIQAIRVGFKHPELSPPPVDSRDPFVSTSPELGLHMHAVVPSLE